MIGGGLTTRASNGEDVARIERVAFLRNRKDTLSILSFAHVLVGEPASTSRNAR